MLRSCLRRGYQVSISRRPALPLRRDPSPLSIHRARGKKSGAPPTGRRAAADDIDGRGAKRDGHRVDGRESEEGDYNAKKNSFAALLNGAADACRRRRGAPY